MNFAFFSTGVVIGWLVMNNRNNIKSWALDKYRRKHGWLRRDF